jgi:hypothetical protein
MSARRYIVVIQAEQGYPATWPSDEIPTPPQPVLHHAVLLTDHADVEAERDRLREALRQIRDFDPFQGSPIAPRATPTEDAMRRIAAEALTPHNGD